MPTFAPDLRKLLVETKLVSLLHEQEVVALRQDATVESALRIMAAHRILSAPVVAAGEGQDASETFKANTAGEEIICFVDIRDILMSFLAELNMEEIKQTKMLKRMKLLESAGPAFAEKPLQSLPVIGGDGSFHLINGVAHSLTILELVHDCLLYPKETKAIHGGKSSRTVVHRVALYDKSFRITHIVSQTDVARFLLKNQSCLGQLGKDTVESLGWAHGSVISITPDISAIQAVEIMREHGISGLAIVSGSGKLMGNFSISDMRTLVSEHFGSMALPVGEFLAKEHGTEFWGVDRRASIDSVEARELDRFAKSDRRHVPGQEVGQELVLARSRQTFIEVLDKLVKNGLHRLYVVDEEMKPIGIITLTDVLRTVINRVK
eukprot:jgi/Botrbrau1/1455/Bobra.178_3s0013.1